MCGRFTYRLTWPEIVKLYRLALETPARNTQPRYNICPTTTIFSARCDRVQSWT
jgi:putative SOS response-associated peptidase YedK